MFYCIVPSGFSAMKFFSFPAGFLFHHLITLTPITHENFLSAKNLSISIERWTENVKTSYEYYKSSCVSSTFCLLIILFSFSHCSKTLRQFFLRLVKGKFCIFTIYFCKAAEVLESYRCKRWCIHLSGGYNLALSYRIILNVSYSTSVERRVFGRLPNCHLKYNFEYRNGMSKFHSQ